MENASNAIIIAGGVLIALLVLSIAAYLFVNYARLGEQYELELSAENIEKINSNFMIFRGRSDIKAQEIVTLKNYVDSFNEKNETSIQVICNGATLGNTQEQYVTFLKNNSTRNIGGVEEYINFRCREVGADGEAGVDIIISPDTGLVERIVFTKI